jgi:hypothetical protein
MLVGERNLQLGLLPNANQGKGVLLKEFSGSRQLRARFRSRENRPAEQFFQAFDAC